MNNILPRIQQNDNQAQEKPTGKGWIHEKSVIPLQFGFGKNWTINIFDRYNI